MIQALQDIISCPGRMRTIVGRKAATGTYVDGVPVHLQLGMLMLNDITITTVNAEIYSPIAQDLKKKSTYGKTMMVTITKGNANSGYIPSDDAFGRYTFLVLCSKLKKGFAKESKVNWLIGLMGKFNR